MNIMDLAVRVYATFRTTPELLGLYRRRDLPALTAFTAKLLVSLPRDPVARRDEAQWLSDIEAVSAPSLDFRAAFVGRRAGAVRRAEVVPRDIVPDELIVAYEVAGEDVALAFLNIVADHRGQTIAGTEFTGAGADPGASVADHWCPGRANLASFGDRRLARRVMRADALADAGLLGQSVNVVIIDEGLDVGLIPPANWGGGLDHFIDVDLVIPAGSAPPTSHGMMIARSVLDLAPQARLYDVPAIPTATPPNIDVFISAVQAAWASLLTEIAARQGTAEWSGPWVLVNAWGIFDTRSDPTGSYTRNTQPGGHAFINLVTQAVESGLDVVFAAGNCGQFCPDERCGGLDRGPGHSIWGANAHDRVITAGAVRSDETWVGYSSQGPGPEQLAVNKPDVCAPSQFSESYDAAALSSGTSAACGMTAGLVAALRGNAGWGPALVSPDALKAAVIAGARKPHGPAGWDKRLGWGIIDAKATIAALP
jgi:hypothetical protein